MTENIDYSVSGNGSDEVLENDSEFEVLENDSEVFSTVAVDYTDVLSSIDNGLKINDALLVALILLLGLLMGLRRL